MQMCLELAKGGIGKVSPNPLVGSVIVKDSEIIASGYHAQVGGAHAELAAIESATVSLEGATLYCNLEPCCHTNKRTPPCAQRIVQEKIAKVVIANLDPNPQVAGNGVQLLRAAGIEVEIGVMQKEGAKLNEIFFTNMQGRRTFVELKMAQTLDGKIATGTGHSKWITGDQSRKLVHSHRARYDAIMVGAHTARIDNPSLTVRVDGKVTSRIRLIFSLAGDLPSDLQIFNDEFKDKTFLVVPEGVTPKLNWPSIACPVDTSGNCDLNALTEKLYQEHHITSVYVEGGSRLHTMFIQQKAFDRLSIFIAPKLMGTGLSPIGDLKISNANEALSFDDFEVSHLGKDLYLTTQTKFREGEQCLPG